MNTKRYIISLSLALALGATTGVQASQANHEGEWSNVVSYGETTIAQDSPNDFGSWKMMVQPAAGPSGVQPPAATPMRPLAQVTTQAPTPRPLATPPMLPPPVATPPVVTPTLVPPPVIVVVTPPVVITPPPPPPPVVVPPPPPTVLLPPAFGAR